MHLHTAYNGMICEQAFAQLALQKAAARTCCLQNLFISNFHHSIMHATVHALISTCCGCQSQQHPMTIACGLCSTADRLNGSSQVEEAEDSNQSANITCMRAQLDSPLKAGSSIDIELYTVHVGLMTPFPAQASQSDPQRVLLKGSHFVASPYPISKQTTKASFAAAVFATAGTLLCIYQLTLPVLSLHLCVAKQHACYSCIHQCIHDQHP